MFCRQQSTSRRWRFAFNTRQRECNGNVCSTLVYRLDYYIFFSSFVLFNIREKCYEKHVVWSDFFPKTKYSNGRNENVENVGTRCSQLNTWNSDSTDSSGKMPAFQTPPVVRRIVKHNIVITRNSQNPVITVGYQFAVSKIFAWKPSTVGFPSKFVYIESKVFKTEIPSKICWTFFVWN